jgi:lipoprotein-releasing system permease protein
MKLAFKIAWRFLTSSKGQTVLIALGIAIGVSVQVFIGSLISGLQASLLDTTIGSSSQITVKANERNGRIDAYEAVMDTIAQEQPSVTFVSPAADAPGFIRIGDDTFPVLARGFDFERAEGIYKLNEALQEGTLPGLDEVMLGKDLVQEAGIKLGDTVELVTPLGTARAVTVSGVYDLKVSSLNKSWLITELPLVQSVFGYGETVTSIEMQVDDVFAADTIAGAIASTLPADLTAENWKDANAALLSGLNGQSISSLIIQVFVLVSVILGIASVLAISVLQKSRQIGILKAMGIKNSSASMVFLFQGVILGTFGAILGVSLGLGLAVSFTMFAVNPDGTPIIELFIDPAFIAVSGLIAVAAATIASLIPARRSSRLDPMEVIKNG